MTKANIDAIMKYLKDGLIPAEIERKLIGGKKVYPRDITQARARMESLKTLSKKTINPIKKPIKKVKNIDRTTTTTFPPIKRYHKPIISFDSLNMDAFLLWIKALDRSQFHSNRASMIYRLQKYNTSSSIEGVVGLLKLYLQEMKS